MRLGTILMFLVAAVLGIAAALSIRAWLEGQSATAGVEAETLVVAATPLRYGTELHEGNLREIAWPSNAIPQGGFKTRSELLQGEKRVVLSAIEANEPILQQKITGPGQRATLSALIDSNMTAVTVRVNDVGGVGGFVLPGDYVDVFLTRTEREHSYTDVLLQNVRVLGIDQIADDRTDKPKVAKAVTLELTTEAAQKVVLAASVGSISLSLRGVGSAGRPDTRRVTLSDLSQTSIVGAPDRQDEKTSEKDDFSIIIGVTRSLKRTEYPVLRLYKKYLAAPMN
jgi:pilus assembly protein CpaB